MVAPMAAFTLPRRALKLVALGIAAALIAAVAAWLFQPAHVPAARVIRPSSGAPLSWPAALTRVDLAVANARERAASRGGEWLIEEQLATALIARGRLTGSFDDYAEAQRALDRAFATAPKGAGPHMTQAALDLTLHRLDGVAAMLDAVDHYAVPAEVEDRNEVTAMRGDVLFYRGRYDAALPLYREAASPFRLAVFAMKTGQPEQALAALRQAEQGARWPTAQALSNLALQRGQVALQRGDRMTAAAEFTRADRLFPGSWLIAAHRAQMLALAGQRDAPIARFEAIARRTPDPMVMDALASLYRARGDYARSRSWAVRAGQGWDARLRQFPEAAYGHAVEHELAFGDPRRALFLARRDFAARPYGATAIALGWARLANNQPAEALRTIQPVLASRWVSADQHLVASQALALLGRGEAADAERARALAINPRAADGDSALIWFGH